MFTLESVFIGRYWYHMGKEATFKVSKFRGKWCVNVSATMSVTGKRHRLMFDTRREAKAEAERRRIAKINLGNQSAQLPHKQRIDAREAIELLEPYGVTLAEVARSYVAGMEAAARSVTMGEAVDFYIGNRPQGEELSPGSVTDFNMLKKRYNFGGKLLSEITPAMVAAALAANTKTPATSNKHRRLLNSVFLLGKDTGWLAENPIKARHGQTKARKVIKTAPEILTVEDAEKLMRAAEAYEGGAYAPYYALCLFAGVRRTREATELRSERVHLDREQPFIEILAVSAKDTKGTGDRFRNVDVSPNLKAWLETYRTGAATVSPCGYGHDDHRDARKAIEAGIASWTKNCLRPSFCSYWQAKHHNFDKLIEMAGHSIAVNRAFYLRAVEEAEAEKFWQIMPRSN